MHAEHERQRTALIARARQADEESALLVKAADALRLQIDEVRQRRLLSRDYVLPSTLEYRITAERPPCYLERSADESTGPLLLRRLPLSSRTLLGAALRVSVSCLVQQQAQQSHSLQLTSAAAAAQVHHEDLAEQARRCHARASRRSRRGRPCACGCTSRCASSPAPSRQRPRCSLAAKAGSGSAHQ